MPDTDPPRHAKPNLPQSLAAKCILSSLKRNTCPLNLLHSFYKKLFQLISCLAQISPSGDQLAFLGPSDKDVLNVFIRSIDNDAKEKLVTNDTHRGIRDYQWSEDGKYILYMQVGRCTCWLARLQQ